MTTKPGPRTGTARVGPLLNSFGLVPAVNTLAWVLSLFYGQYCLWDDVLLFGPSSSIASLRLEICNDITSLRNLR